MIIIPARQESTRLPNKVLLDVCGKPLIWYSIQTALKTKERVIVASDSDEVLKVCGAWCETFKTPPTNSGTEKVYLAAKTLEPPGGITNQQADVPLINEDVYSPLLNSDSYVSTLYYESSEGKNPNQVKIVGKWDKVHNCEKALYFSRSEIPHQSHTFKIHIGIYQFFSLSTLQECVNAHNNDFVSENLEQLHWPYDIQLIKSPPLFNIDTKEDLEGFRGFVEENSSLWA